MIKIGITGSLASGKTTASKILSIRRGPLFSADRVVKKLYQNSQFKLLIRRRFKIKKNNQIKKHLKHLILKNEKNIRILEKIIHPIVRKEMRRFTLENHNKKFLFYEIPLLVENKLMKKFNVVIFIKAKKKLRLKRFKLKNGNKNLFNLLNNEQMPDKKKIKSCDHVIVNDRNLNILKKNLFAIINKYE